MSKPIRYRTWLIYAMSKLQSLSEKLFLVVLAIGFPEEIGRLRYLLWTASLVDSGQWRISTFLELCQNYMSLCVRIGKIERLRAPINA